MNNNYNTTTNKTGLLRRILVAGVIGVLAIGTITTVSTFAQIPKTVKFNGLILKEVVGPKKIIPTYTTIR